jgi:hypothetical protein
LNLRLAELAHKPFDLESGPLMRVYIFNLASKERLVLLVIHHIIFDGWSLWVLLDELAAICDAQSRGAGDRLPPARNDYADYVHWQRKMLEGPEGESL